MTGHNAQHTQRGMTAPCSSSSIPHASIMLALQLAVDHYHFGSPPSQGFLPAQCNQGLESERVVHTRRDEIAWSLRMLAMASMS